jgi:hypothetical protein
VISDRREESAVDWFYWTFEREDSRYKIASEEDYRLHFPEAMEAIEKAFTHKFSTAKKDDYWFSCLDRPNSSDAHHRVVYESRQTPRGEWEISPIAFDVYYRRSQRLLNVTGNQATVQIADWWEVYPPFPMETGAKWG